MKETLERQWPEEIEEHLLAVAGHNTDVKKQHNQMEGEREREKKRFCANYCTPQKLHLANSVLDRETVAPLGGARDQKMQEVNGRCSNLNTSGGRESKRPDAGPESCASFFPRCLNVAARHKPIARFESPCKHPLCDRGGVISCAG